MAYGHSENPKGGISHQYHLQPPQIHLCSRGKASSIPQRKKITPRQRRPALTKLQKTRTNYGKHALAATKYRETTPALALTRQQWQPRKTRTASNPNYASSIKEPGPTTQTITLSHITLSPPHPITNFAISPYSPPSLIYSTTHQ